MSLISLRLFIPFLFLAVSFSVAPAYAQSFKTSNGFYLANPDYKTAPQKKKNTRHKAGGAGLKNNSVIPDKDLSARSAIIMDGDTGEILYARSINRPGQPASTIKVLTALLAIRYLNDHERVKVSRRASRMPRSKIYLRKGKKYYADDLINAVLLASANDASVALAEKIAGSEKVFAKLMTYKARSMGAGNTLCKTATGLTARGQHTTVKDLAVIFAEAMKDKEFARRVKYARIKTREGKLLVNHNKALWRITGARGGKTGYTRAARQTYVGMFKRRDDDLVVAIMGSESMWDDISRLVEFGFAEKNKTTSPKIAGRRRTPPDLLKVHSLASEEQTALQLLSDSKKLSKL